MTPLFAASSSLRLGPAERGVIASYAFSGVTRTESTRGSFLRPNRKPDAAGYSRA